MDDNFIEAVERFLYGEDVNHMCIYDDDDYCDTLCYNMDKKYSNRCEECTYYILYIAK